MPTAFGNKLFGGSVSHIIDCGHFVSVFSWVRKVSTNSEFGDTEPWSILNLKSLVAPKKIMTKSHQN